MHRASAHVLAHGIECAGWRSVQGAVAQARPLAMVAVAQTLRCDFYQGMRGPWRACLHLHAHIRHLRTSWQRLRCTFWASMSRRLAGRMSAAAVDVLVTMQAVFSSCAARHGWAVNRTCVQVCDRRAVEHCSHSGMHAA